MRWKSIRKNGNYECDKLKNVTTFFSLDELENVIVNLRKTPNIDLKGSDDRIIKSSILKLVCVKASFDEVLMSLFVSYYEESKNTENIWVIIKANISLLLLFDLWRILYRFKKT